MAREPGCTLTADDTAFVLDRLAGLEKVISQDAMQRALSETRRVQKRSCKLTLEVILWVAPAKGILTGLPIRQVFKFSRRMRSGEPSPATKPVHLRSQTPSGVIQELFALSLAHFVIRSLMFEAAQDIGIDSDRLSFTGRFQILKCRLPECRTATKQTIQEWYESLLWEMQQEILEPGRNRINPKVITQKIMKWPKNKPSTEAHENTRKIRYYLLIQRYWR